MNIFETLSEKEVVNQKKELADNAVEEAKKGIKEKILDMAENSDNPMIKSHLREIREDRNRLGELNDDDLEAFNEIIVKNKWKEWAEKNNPENTSKLEKYRKKVLDYAINRGKTEDKFEDCKDVRCTFSAMIHNYITDCEDAEKREILINNARKRFVQLSKEKPHIAAYIEGINWRGLWNSDLKIVDNLHEPEILNHEKKLKVYFEEKFKKFQGENVREQKRILIENDPRFKYYCAAKEALNLGPCQPDIFLQI